jgi:hypothetical protein
VEEDLRYERQDDTRVFWNQLEIGMGSRAKENPRIEEPNSVYPRSFLDEVER